MAAMSLLRIYLGFAAAYFLSYLFRMVNAVISPDLARDLGLTASELGLLTAAYPFAFMSMQLPLGVLIDRYGPRKVETTLLVVAASGALLFGLADSTAGLVVARALIGAGVSGCLMCALNGFQRWFPPEKRPAMTGWIMVAAGLGGVFATAPAEWGVSIAGWRAVFYVLAALTLLAALLVWQWVPASPRGGAGETVRIQLAGMLQVVRSPRFRHIAPLMAINMGSFMAIQGLWSVPWMMQVDGLSQGVAAGVLLAMAGVMLGGYFTLGMGTARLARMGIGYGALFALGMAGSLLAFALIVLRAPLPPLVLWVFYGGMITVSSFAFNLMAQGVPLQMVGRATTALNVLIFLGHVVAQWGVGVGVDALLAAGSSRAEAMTTVFQVLLAANVAAYVWFAAAWRGVLREPDAAVG